VHRNYSLRSLPTVVNQLHLVVDRSTDDNVTCANKKFDKAGAEDNSTPNNKTP
jgi:hypothetical protein